MKKLILLVAVLALFGCEIKDPFCCGIKPSSNSNVDSETIVAMELGEICGGPDSLQCGAGLACEREEPRAESMGVCVDTVVDKSAECDKNKAPVCGLKGRQKNGYLNECEAHRHGAKILHEWFCKVEPDVKNNCKAQVLGVGNCEIFFVGYEFNDTECVEVGVGGCEAEIPFSTLKDCQMECL